tara:strand:- start:211 stop:429 length:219 start_codon:yes stop_codon:yes gene_type:complete
MGRLKVEGFNSLVRDTSTNAIVNTNVSDYQIYMQRRQAREDQSDKIRGAVKEINSLKKELREIKELLVKVIK